MRRLLFNAALLHSPSLFYQSLALQCNLPAAELAGPEALEPLLASIAEPAELVLEASGSVKEEYAEEYARLKALLDRACAANRALTLTECSEHCGGFVMRCAHVGNPDRPDVPFDAQAMRKLKALGFNTVQLNIAWGPRPGDEPLNLEDILSPDDKPDERQRRWFDEIARRAALAKAEGMHTLFHFGAPRMTTRLYKILGDPRDVERETEENSPQKEEIVRKYETLLTMLAERIPQVDDILMYTFDQEAWLGSEFGDGPLAAGIPLDKRIPGFLRRLTACWNKNRPGGRLWWEPWEISAGTIYTVLPELPRENFGLMLHSNIAEVQFANPADRWLRNMALLAKDYGIPVCGEVFLTGANEEVEPLQHAFAPALVWDEAHRLQELGLYGIKEYFGTRPDMPCDLNLEMAGVCFAQPALGKTDALAALAARWPEAWALADAMDAGEKALALFPWDVSWRWRVLCGQHTEWHPYTPWWIPGNVAESPSWRSTRRGLFMLTTDEENLHPWLIEDIGLRCRAAAEAMRTAAQYYMQASMQCEDGAAADCFAAAGEDYLRFCAVAMDEFLHAEETLCAANIRRLSKDGKLPGHLYARMHNALRADVENQKNTLAVAEGARSHAEEALQGFVADPVEWCKTHF